MAQPTPVTQRYAAGARLRVKQICSDKKRPTPGLLPICDGTWYKWIREGRVPAGEKLGSRTVVWTIEQVLAVGAANNVAAE